MKKQLPAFLLGMLTATLVAGLTVTALATSGQMTITVDPINIQVNGETFQPKDANGNDVAVFAYNGTTYAPLRALAEAYGLEVGYDPETNMATVKEPEGGEEDPGEAEPDVPVYNWSEEEEAAYQEFVSMCELSEEIIQSNDSRVIKFVIVNEDKLYKFEELGSDVGYKFIMRRTLECAATYPNIECITVSWESVYSRDRYWGARCENGRVSLLVDHIWNPDGVSSSNPLPLN